MRVAIVGGGAAGLLSALMLHRAGHEVVLYEQDDVGVAPDVEAAAEAAYRPSAPQLVQAHVVMSRCRLVLAERLPDVLGALMAAGCLDVPLSERLPPGLSDLSPEPGDEQYRTVMTRRSTFDWVLRRAVVEESGIELCPARVVGLTARLGTAPHVTGLRTGEWERAADVVVDACGRRSSVDRWLEEIGAWPAERRSADCGVTYFGRHYRFISGSSLPGPPTTRIVVGFAEFTAVLFCSDNGAVQTALIPLTADRRFRHLGEPGVYDAVMGLVPTHAPWMGTLEPISPVHQMVAPHNTLRRLVIEGEPVVTGLLPVGDSVCTTNPTFGRGLSLAAWGASDLVEVLAESPDDQVAQALSLDARIAEHVVPYYEDQAKVDEGRLVMLRSAVFGTSVPEPPPGGPQVTFARLRYASAVNPVAFRGFWSLMGMLKPPNEVYGDPAVIDAVERASADGFPDDPAPDASLLAAALQR